MSEVVVAFGGAEGIESLADGMPEGVDGTGLPRFEAGS